MKKIPFCFVLLLLLAACDEKVDWTLQTGVNNFPVVDATLTDELKTQSVRITKPVVNINMIPEAVRGAEVMVSGDNQVYSFTEEAGNPGNYVSDLPFSGKMGKQYSLFITVSGVIYTAKASMPAAVINFLPARYIRTKAKGLYHINWVANPYDPRHPAMFEILLDWSSVAGYRELDSASTHARLLYYSLPTLDVSEVLSPNAEEVQFPAGTHITERRYSLTFEHAAFLRALLSETSWQGGLFNSASSNVPTNLSAGACGFFGACAVTTKTDVAGAIAE